MSQLGYTIIRKTLHIVFSLLLLIPLFHPIQSIIGRNPGIDEPLIIYTVLTLGAALVNSLQIRIPNFRKTLSSRFNELRRKMLMSIELKAWSKHFESLDRAFERMVYAFNGFIDKIERDYEKRYGYVCITFALLSVMISYVLFSDYVFYGIITLAIVDGFSAIFTALHPKFVELKVRGRVLRPKHSLTSIVLTTILSLSIYYILCRDFIASLIMAFTALIVELLSPEDNLTLPITSSFVAWILKISLPI